MAKAKRAVIFDLDGTLIHSLPDLTQSLNVVLTKHGRASLSDAEVGPMVGDGAKSLVERAFAARGGLDGDVAPYLAEFLAHYESNATVLTRPFPGLIHTLEELKRRGIRLAVCTNKPSAATREILSALDLEKYFEVIIGGDDTPVLKPSPIHILTVLNAMKVDVEDSVMVGDSKNDVLAATGCNMASIVVSFGYAQPSPHELGATLVVDEFTQIIRAVAGR